MKKVIVAIAFVLAWSSNAAVADLECRIDEDKYTSHFVSVYPSVAAEAAKEPRVEVLQFEQNVDCVESLQNLNETSLVAPVSKPKTITFGVSKKNLDKNIEAITKFLKWEEMAKQRGDVLTKQIAVVQGHEAKYSDEWIGYYFNRPLKVFPPTLNVVPGSMTLGQFAPRNKAVPSFTVTAVAAANILKQLQAFKDQKSVADDYN